MAVDYTRSINRVEIYGHPTNHRLRQFKVQYRATDAGALTDVTPDTLTMESRLKGGGATISWNSTTKVYTMTGDYAGINLTAAVSMANLRVVCIKSTDLYFEIMEVRAMLTVDVSGRVASLSVGQDSDFTLRRIKARTLQLTLDNTDGVLHTTGTSSYADQLGAGMRFICWAGYAEAPDEWVRQGTYYLDRWTENRTKATVSVTARDGVKIMSTQVNAGYKTGYRNFEIIEYLGNLAGIASTDMILDRSASVIDYFAMTQANAYQEAQKIAEAACFSELYFDANGYLTFRAVGSTVGNTTLEGTFPSITRTMGPVAFLSDAVYVMLNAGTTKLAKYDIAASTWSNLGNVASSITILNGFSVAWDGAVYSFGFPSASITGDVMKWDGTTSSVVGRFEGGAGVTSLFDWAILQKNNLIFAVPKTGNNPNYYFIFDLAAMSLKKVTLALAAGEVIADFCNESGKLWIFTDVNGTGSMKIYEWDEFAGTVTARATITQSEIRISYGMTGDGAGTIYVAPGTDGGVLDHAFTIYSFDTSTYAVTSLGNVTNTSERNNGGDFARTICQGMAYADGILLTGYSKTFQGSYSTHLVMRDSQSGGAGEDLGPLHLSSSRIEHFLSVAYGGQTLIYGQMDSFRLFEFYVRRKIPQQTSSSFTISDASSGVLVDLSIGAGDEAGGESSIITEAVVKSSPLFADASATLWSASDLPWGLDTGLNPFKIHLSEPCPPSSQSVIITNTGTILAYVDGTNGSRQHPQEPTMSVVTTVAGIVSALSVTGTPLRNKSTLVSVVFSSAASISRYGIKRFAVENDYIYDAMAQAVIAASLVQRFSSKKIKIENLRSIARWTLEMFDRVTVTDSVTGVNADFYVTGFAHDYLAQTSTLKVVQV